VRPVTPTFTSAEPARVQVPWRALFLGKTLLCLAPLAAINGEDFTWAIPVLMGALLMGNLGGLVSAQRYDRLPALTSICDGLVTGVWCFVAPSIAIPAFLLTAPLAAIIGGLASRRILVMHWLVTTLLVLSVGEATGVSTEATAAYLVAITALGFGVSLGANRVRARNIERLTHRSLHDPLSGLPNRGLARRRAHEIMGASRWDHPPVAMLVVDLDRFRDVNDAFGHGFGDALLDSVARRLSELLGPDDTVSRSGNDEFTMLIPGASERIVSVLAGRIHQALSRPVHIDGIAIRTTVAIGFALSPDHATDPVELERLAHLSLRTAKSSGRRTVAYDPGTSHSDQRQVGLLGQLDDAVANGQLEVWYQPQLDLGLRRIVGAEALVRWRHPRHGLLQPDEFIGLAEAGGAIEALTRLVIEQAVHDAHRLDALGLELMLSCNISVRSISDDHLVHFVDDLIRTIGMPAAGIELELTETGIMDDPVMAKQIFHALRERGIRTAIDDFGTGYSSLAHLRHLRLDVLKIDRSLVTGAAGDDDGELLIRTIVELAHNLGMTVVAEGAEDRQTLDMLRDQGCEVAQGYEIGRAMPLDDLIAMLRPASIDLTEPGPVVQFHNTD